MEGMLMGFAKQFMPQGHEDAELHRQAVDAADEEHQRSDRPALQGDEINRAKDLHQQMYDAEDGKPGKLREGAAQEVLNSDAGSAGVGSAVMAQVMKKFHAPDPEGEQHSESEQDQLMTFAMAEASKVAAAGGFSADIKSDLMKEVAMLAMKSQVKANGGGVGGVFKMAQNFI